MSAKVLCKGHGNLCSSDPSFVSGYTGKLPKPLSGTLKPTSNLSPGSSASKLSGAEPCLFPGVGFLISTMGMVKTSHRDGVRPCIGRRCLYQIVWYKLNVVNVLWESLGQGHPVFSATLSALVSLPLLPDPRSPLISSGDHHPCV